MEDGKIRRDMRAVSDIESISIYNKEWMKARRIVVGSTREALRNQSS